MGETNLPPGFRFRPTDVELVRYYLRRKVMGKKLLYGDIAELDIYNFDPPELPGKSSQRTGDLKWYFFCPREKRYPNSIYSKRSTKSGYWKTTGRDRDVTYNNHVVGKVRTLIFHYGRPPRGDRTNWVMHEHRLEDKALTQKNVCQDCYVLCVLFNKKGPGPKNGSDYGAPFIEEDWSDDEEEDNAIPSSENIDPGPRIETNLVATASHLHAPKDCFNGVKSESWVSNVQPLKATLNVDPGPRVETSLVATASHLHAPRYCFNGVKSESCVSDVHPPKATLTVDPGPRIETSLVATASHSHAPKDCFNGVKAESCVSDVQPLTATVLPPQTSDVTPISPPLELEPLDDDDLEEMDQFFDSLLVNKFQNQNEFRHDDPCVATV